MKKRIILILCLFLLGCEQKPTPGLQIDAKVTQQSINSLNESVELLAVKYGIDSKVIVNIIGDYEEMTLGFSVTRLMHDASHNIVPKESEIKIVDIPTALEIVSNKYQVPKEKVASMLIDNKMIESSIRNNE